MQDSLTLTGPDGLQITVHPYGASWLGARVRLRDGSTRQAVLGLDSEQALRANASCVGATVGRYANRIAGARLQRGGQQWELHTEPHLNHQLHGGPQGFHRRDWALQSSGPDQAVFALHSPSGDQGFPGDLSVTTTYRLMAGQALEIHFDAQVQGQATPLVMTNHAYFQLDGQALDVREQSLQLDAAQVLPTGADGLPTGAPQPVAGGPLDYRQLRPVGQRLDHAFLMQPGGAARLQAADGRLALRVSSSLPALQVYTGEHLARGTQERWPAFSGMALEPGYLPDSPHHPEWPQPSCWLEPGQRWKHHIRYEFQAL